MLKLRLSAFFCMLFVGSGFSMLQNEKEVSISLKEQEGKVDELQRRQEIAEDYISTLDKIKESWIDPYQMMSCQTKECKDILKKRENIYTTNTIDEETSSDATNDVIDNKLSQIDEVPNTIKLPNEPLVIDKAQSSRTNVYFTRWVKKLLLLIEKENIDDYSLISFSLNEEVLNHLKELSNENTLEVSQVDEIFTDLLNNAIIHKKKIYDWTDILDYTKYIVWMIAAGSVTIFILYLFYTTSINHPYLTTFFLFMALAVFWHWMHLFQQRVAFKQAELASMSIPKECMKHDFGFFEHVQEYLKSFFKSNNCVKYHEALSVDPVWEVSITVAISEAIAAFLLQPLSTGSHILNKSLKHLFDELTLDVKIFLISLILLMLIMKCNYRIRLPYFMGVIEPCHPVGSSVQNIQPTKSLTESSRENVMKVLNYFQGEDKKPIKQIEYDMLSYSTNETIENVQSSEPVQSILRPSGHHTCGCLSKSCIIGPVEKIKSVTNYQIEGENEPSVSGSISSETSDNYLNQPVDNSVKISKICIENSETKSSKSTTKSFDDSTVSPEVLI